MARPKRLQSDYAHLPGLREHLRESFARDAECDPRLYLPPTGEDRQASKVEMARLSETSRVSQSARRMLRMLDDGEAVTVPSWYVGGNYYPGARQIPWIADRSTPFITVDRFDRVTPMPPFGRAIPGVRTTSPDC
ncbi:hypothetical protein MTY66_47890 [Mycolicibacterium sp. TY66]|uniref:hypothetical protein n=1 Tax=Mycobacteriaceae TaxID=1762 RepID=UPI001BB3424F|nr:MULTISPECIES: hypothetical protein [unclassified Mycolicibacterium]BCI83164.1 hypothetical protein MTY66_47890 [Mycolicibacterium sp. TY66]BCJ79190.1 hypothetical protein MTY81_05630 [Mycolicibacterium sp. TY81]